MTHGPQAAAGTSRRIHHAFTLIELLVVISIIALLVAILLPSLSKAREQARETVCAANLSGFGTGFHSYASDNRDYFCSGSFDPDVENGRDGPVDEVGWVADLVNAQLAFPNDMLCPSSQAQVNQKLGVGGSAGCDDDGCYTLQEVEALIEDGYNSNYTQAWYMARTEAVWPNAENDPNFKRVKNTEGPLRVSYMISVTPSRVPILGDGGLESDDTYLGDHFDSRLTVKSLTDGMAGGAPWGVQTYTDFGPSHGLANRTRIGNKSSRAYKANILFADGHVDKFIDKIRDGEFTLLRQGGDPQFYIQEDLDPQVFDGVLSLGRRSLAEWQRR